jgi:hypothetical protein
MASDEQTSGIVSTPKGGLYGGLFDPTGFGIDPNTLALLIDARWTTMFNGPNPATTIPYAFPAQASDYTAECDFARHNILPASRPDS